MNKVLCIRNYFGFEKGKTYNVINVSSVFEDNDFITIELSFCWYRFRLNTSIASNELIGENESYFYNYFCDIREARKLKLKSIENEN